MPHLWPMYFRVEILFQFACHVKFLIEFPNVMIDILAGEIHVVVHVGEVLENFLTFELEETLKLLNLCVLDEHFFILKLLSVLRVVTHHILSQESQGVKPVSN